MKNGKILISNFGRYEEINIFVAKAKKELFVALLKLNITERLPIPVPPMHCFLLIN
jgi:hypothetical protein